MVSSRITNTGQGCFSTQRRERVYTETIQANPRSVVRYMRPCSIFDSSFSRYAHIMGVVVSEMSIETIIAVDSVMANSRNSRPTIPAMRRIGMKTAISDMLIEKMVNPISLEP